jgi:asparagine synthase (glutamine-hydrolysing)
LRTGLNSLVNELLEKRFIQEQNIFNYDSIERMKLKLFSSDSGDSHAVIWSLLVFQYWYRKYFIPNA